MTFDIDERQYLKYILLYGLGMGLLLTFIIGIIEGFYGVPL
jgi:hypothetical protein